MNKLMLAVIVVFATALAASASCNAFLYVQNQTQTTNNLNQKVVSLTQQTDSLTAQMNNLTQQMSNLISQRQLDAFNGTNYEAAQYYNEFGVIPTTNVNASFAPPVSMYRALQIGLEYDGWNKTSLQNFTLSIYLMPWDTYNSSTGSGGITPSNSTYTANGWVSIPANYNDVYGNDGIVYRYVWQISIEKSGEGWSIPPWDLILIDASTGLIVPHGPLF